MGDNGWLVMITFVTMVNPVAIVAGSRVGWSRPAGPMWG